MKKSDALGKPPSRFLSKARVLDKTMLEVDRSHDKHTVGKRWVANLETFVLNQINQMQDPRGIVGNGLE